MKIASREIGLGQETIVILHGLFGSSRNWTSIANKLSSDYRIILPDLPNHGLSGWTDNVSYKEQAHYLVDFLLKNCAETVTLLGHSMGGKLAMTIALTKPNLIKRLIVVDIAPVVYHNDNLDILDSLVDVNLQTLRKREDAHLQLKEKIPDKRIRDFLLQNLVSVKGGYDWRINIKVLRDKIKDIEGFPCFSSRNIFRKPALFLAGQNSNFIQSNEIKQIKKYFLHSEVKYISNAGHWLHADNPREFVRVVNKFIEN